MSAPEISRTSQQKAANHSALLVTANACMFVFGVILLLMGSLLPSLQVSYSQAGSLGSFPLAGILVATLLVGPVLDTVGAKSVLVFALALIAASLSAIPSLHEYHQLAVAAFLYGFGGGIVNTATNALVADLSAGGRAAALNLLGFSFSLGAFSAPLAMSSIARSSSPAVLLRSLALLCVALLALILLLRFPAPSRAGTRIQDLLAVLKHSMIWLFAAALFFESGSENCMFVWAAKIVADIFHVSAQQANLALVALSGALGIGRLLAVWWTKWLGNRGTVLLSTVIVLAGVLVVGLSGTLPMMVTGMGVIGLGLSAIFPTLLGMTGDSFPKETGTVFGAVMTIALVGGTSGPALAGWLAAQGPLQVLWLPAASTIAVGTLVLTCLPSKRAQN
jgi:FHS family glucose/mannose:H+ symporter-like MFS transporter